MKPLLLCIALSIISLFVISSIIGDEGAETGTTMKLTDGMHMEAVVDEGRPVDTSSDTCTSDILLCKSENQLLSEMDQDGNKLGIDVLEVAGRRTEEARITGTDGSYCVVALHDGSGVKEDDCKATPIAGQEGGQQMTQEGPDAVLEELASTESDIEKRLGSYNVVVEWVRSHEGLWQYQSVKYIPGAGIGVIASEDIKNMTVILRTPLALIISGLGLNYLSRALFLVSEKVKESSPLKAYIDCLPEKEGIPLTFTTEEMDLLEGSEVQNIAQELQQTTFSDIDMLLSDLKSKSPNKFGYIRHADLLWGLTMWLTRTYTVYVPSEDGTRLEAGALVPLADMYNAAIKDRDSNVMCGYFEDSYDFECWTTRDIITAEELLTDYNYNPLSRHNHYLLSTYGFVIKDNPHDAVTMQPPKLDIKVTHLQVRETILRKYDIMQIDTFMLNRTDEDGYGSVNELLQFFRLSLGTVGEIQHESKTNNPFMQPLSPRTELKVHKAALKYVSDALAGYPTTAEEDATILQKNEHLSSNARNAILLRHDEKVLLQDTITYLTHKLQQLLEVAH